ILTGWTGSSTPVFLKLFNDDLNFGVNDGLAVCRANTASCTAAGTGADNILGRINLGGIDYLTGAAALNATLAWNAGTSSFTVTVGSVISGGAQIKAGSASTATFTPLDGATQAGGIR